MVVMRHDGVIGTGVLKVACSFFTNSYGALRCVALRLQTETLQANLRLIVIAPQGFAKAELVTCIRRLRGRIYPPGGARLHQYLPDRRR